MVIIEHDGGNYCSDNNYIIISTYKEDSFHSLFVI